MPRRICHISTVHPTFDQRIFHRECWSAQRAGYETHLIVQHDERESMVDGIHLHAVDRPRKNTAGMRLGVRLRRFWRVIALASALKADVYHLHDPELIPVGLWLKRVMRRRVIFDCHENNSAYIEQKYYLPSLVRRTLIPMMVLMEQLAARTFDAIVTADQGVADIYMQKYGARHVLVLHNFPRLDLFSSINGHVTPTVDVIYHGSIPKYHLEVTFNVAKVLKERGRKVSWLFFGNGPAAEWVNREAAKYGVADVFTYVPQRIPHEQVAAHVRQARVGFIPLPDLPKFQQNIPTKLFEYMALGLPVILSDLPPSRPFVGDGRGGVMVRADDYEGYADAIIDLLDDEDLRRSMGEEGRQKVLNQYNWETEAVKLIDLYKLLDER